MSEIDAEKLPISCIEMQSFLRLCQLNVSIDTINQLGVVI